jgi:hypothetical protein
VLIQLEPILEAIEVPSERRPTNITQPEPLRRVVIRVRGHLGPTLLEAFPALTANREGEDTLLSGPLSDQAALYGVLHQIEALGLELLEVRCPRRQRARQIT